MIELTMFSSSSIQLTVPHVVSENTLNYTLLYVTGGSMVIYDIRKESQLQAKYLSYYIYERVLYKEIV
jgi:hypothetical protein